MRVLSIHNFYQQAGGEDQVFANETALLESHGDEVVRYTVHNDDVRGMGGLALARATLWNRDAYDALRAVIRERRPDVLHAHNTFPLISPAAYAAAADEGVAVVQSLHNYRLLCANVFLYRDGHVCEDCVGRRIPWPAVAHRCYRGSVAASAAAAGMVQLHRARGTWRRDVDVYVALTEFARDKFVANGLPADRVVVKPNFVAEGPGPSGVPGEYALFVGRLSPEKGVGTLLAAWALDATLPRLVVVGDGPMADTVRHAAANDPRIEWRGPLGRTEIAAAYRSAAFLVCSSEWYEGFPMVLAEAFASGLPVVAASIGAMGIIVEDGRTGWHFTAGDASALATAVRRAWAGRAGEAMNFAAAAFAQYRARYSPEVNYGQLRAIYARALETRARASATRAARGASVSTVGARA